MDKDEEYEEAKAKALQDHMLEMCRIDATSFALSLHARALACHCECLGMNAENSLAVSMGAATIPFNNSYYRRAAQKWGLINKKGEPAI